ncbi:ABC transporter substrate-binding protein [Streptomyces beijiangensis]|uniref:ABC transporter substrate-binding protein n=1 Tax=Streptomyces beijiangensis TaxID=163361 RepID=A0A939JK49_9ACTN|nr:ABC transporter substrate-binding protein [Streptomyces beijiangensis]MBO0514925.1 ABC transporter substrate-binding protein [Streptomyces beijiangensis]
MSIIRSRTAQVAVVAATAGALALTGCSSNSNSNAKEKTKTKQDAASQAKAVVFGDAAASTGPAAAVAGARSGGTATVYQEDDFSHLDPGQIYVSDGGLLSKLLFRGLTTYKEDAKGNQTVVGDVATDSGKMSDGGKTWTYTLKSGVKDETGHEINSADIRHSIERLYAPFITDGPVYIQQWLSGGGTAYRKAYAGPFKGNKHLPDSVLATPDDKTVVFHFKDAQPDLPQALAMAGYSIVPEKTDTQAKYDTKPVAIGPYKIAEYKSGKSLKIVRNTNWDEKTDATRHAYVDGFNIEYNHDKDDQTKTILADRGEAKNAIMFTGQVATNELKDVVQDPAAMKRTVQGYAPYVWQLNFNMDRVKDKRVRDAIALAMPSTAVYKADGGAYGGEPASSLLSPTTPGFDASIDPFNRGKKPNGDIAAAKKLIDEAGAKGMKLVYAYANTPVRQQQAVLIADALNKIGLDIQKKEIDSATWYEQMGKVKNGLDLYMTGWGQDWPSGNTVIPPSFDGTQIQDGSSNYSHTNDAHVNSEILRIQKITDAAAAAKEWAKLSQYITEKINPAAPIYYTKVFQIAGSNVGGLRYSTVTSYTDVTQIFLKK